MMTVCKNCTVQFHGNYCYNCGQPANTRDFTFAYLWESVLHIFHVEKGLFFTIKALFTRPGYAIREYIEGKRVQYIKPLVFLFLMTVIYDVLYRGGVMLHWIPKGDEETHGLWKILDFLGQGGYGAIAVCFIFSVFARIAFWKSDFNYIQHVIVNAFVQAQLTIFDIVFLPLEIEGMEAFDLPSLVLDILIFAIYLSWVYIQCFDKQSKLKNILFTCLAVFLCAAFLFLFIIIAQTVSP